MCLVDSFDLFLLIDSFLVPSFCLQKEMSIYAASGAFFALIPPSRRKEQEPTNSRSQSNGTEYIPYTVVPTR